MTPEQNDMEDLFRSVFEDASLEPPHKEKMWENIAFAIQKPPVVPMHRTMWFRVSSIAASVALLLGATYYLNTSEPIANEQATVLSSDEKVNQEQIIKDENKSAVIPQNEALTENKVNSNAQDAPLKETETTDNVIPSNKNTEEKIALPKKENVIVKEQENTLAKNPKSPSLVENKVENKLLENKEIAKEQSNQPITATLPTQAKDENAFSLVRFEVKEIITLIPADLVIPYQIDRQPIIQLVIVDAPHAQEEKTKVASNYWIGFGGFYNAYQPNFGFTSPELPSALISSNSGIASINYGRGTNVAEQLKQNLVVESAYTVNFDFGKTLSNHWFVRSGLGLTNNRYIVEARITNRLGDVKDDSNTSVLQSAGTIYHDNFIRNSTSILNIPIQIGFQSNRKGLNYFISSGLSSDITLNNSLSNTFRDASYDFGRYKAVNFSAIGSAGLLYNFTPHFSMLFEMNYRRSLTSVYHSPNLQSHPQWIGIGIGVRKKF